VEGNRRRLHAGYAYVVPKFATRICFAEQKPEVWGKLTIKKIMKKTGITRRGKKNGKKPVLLDPFLLAG